jgi:hypothetical protein
MMLRTAEKVTSRHCCRSIGQLPFKTDGYNPKMSVSPLFDFHYTKCKSLASTNSAKMPQLPHSKALSSLCNSHLHTSKEEEESPKVGAGKILALNTY